MLAGQDWSITMAEDYSELIAEIAARPLIERDELKRMVEGHIEAARVAFAESTFFDQELPALLGQACLSLLEIEGLDEAEQRLVMAACVYFVEDDDEDGDFSSIVGFEDDADVYDQVVKQLGRPELALPPR
jgi:hypothetical protein